MTINRELCILRSMEHGFHDDLTAERRELTLNLALTGLTFFFTYFMLAILL